MTPKVGSIFIGQKRILICKENEFYLFEVPKGSKFSAYFEVFTPEEVPVFLQPSNLVEEKFFRSYQFANPLDITASKILEPFTYLFSGKGRKETSFECLDEKESLFVSLYYEFYKRVSVSLEGESVVLSVDGKKVFSAPAYFPAKSLRIKVRGRPVISLACKGELESKEKKEEVDSALEELKKSLESQIGSEITFSVDKKQSAFPYFLKGFLIWLSRKTGTPLPVYLSLKEGEKLILPTVYAVFKVSPYSFGYYELVDRIGKDSLDEGKEKRENPLSTELQAVKDVLKRYFLRKSRLFPTVKVGNGTVTVQGLKNASDEFFKLFLETGKTVYLKACAGLLAFQKEKDPQQVSYVREIFGVGEDKLAGYFLTSTKEAEERLFSKAEDLKESFFPSLKEPSLSEGSLKQLLKLPLKENPVPDNVLEWYLNSIDTEKLNSELKDYVKALREAYEGGDYFYSFNF